MGKKIKASVVCGSKQEKPFKRLWLLPGDNMKTFITSSAPIPYSSGDGRVVTIVTWMQL